MVLNSFLLDLNYRIHFTGLFFPWHRWYLQVFEDSLKSKCGYRGASPYWNWALGDAPVSCPCQYLDTGH